MKNSKVKNNVFLVLLSVLLLVGSIFAFTTFKSKNNVVYADSVSTSFNGSSVYVPFTPQYYGYNHSWVFLDSSNDVINGYNVWTDGVSYYYSFNNNQYILDISNHTWSTMTWTGLTNFNGSNVWTDGVSYYYSNNNSQYILDISNHTLSTMTWTGLTNFYGSYIWTDGVSYYYSSNNNQYVLDISNHTWSTMTWTGLTSFEGSNVFNIGDICYSLSSGFLFRYDKGALENRFDYSVFDSVAFTFTDLGNSFVLTQHSVFYYPYDNSMNFVLSDKITQQLFSTDFISYFSFSYNESLLQNS